MDLLDRLWQSEQLTSLLLTGLATASAAAVAWLGVQFRRYVLSRLTANELELLRNIARDSVRYVEQTMRKGKAEDKLAEAIRVANVYLRAYHMKVHPDQLRAIIEATVYSDVVKTELPVVVPADG